MNARLVALLCTVSTVMLAKFAVAPQLSKARAVASDIAEREVTLRRTNELLADAKRLPVSPVKLATVELATAIRVSAALTTQRNYGVQIAQVTSTRATGAQPAFALATLNQPHAATGLMTQQLVIKGRYDSLNDFADYLQAQWGSEEGVLLEGLKLQGDNFEGVVSIFGLAEKN
jgi:hypothetical protein